MRNNSYFQGIVVFYDKTIKDGPDTLYFYKKVSDSTKRKDKRPLTLKSFSHYLYSIKWKSLKNRNDLIDAINRFDSSYTDSHGNLIHIFHSTVTPSKSKLDSVPSIQDRKKYKALEASVDFKNRASSNAYPLFVKNFNCPAIIFNHVEMTKIYKEYCSEVKDLFEQPSWNILRIYMDKNIPLKYDTFCLFPEPIRYDSGVSIERDYLDEYSAYIGNRFIPAKNNIVSSLYRSLKDTNDNPEHYVRAILEESFTQFILFVQEKRLDLKDLNKDMLVACAAYVFKNYTYDKLFEKCTADMYDKAASYFDSEADNLVKEFKEDPAKVYKEYVQIFNTNRTAYPMYAVRKAPGVIDAYKWNEDDIAAYKKANNITLKKYRKRSNSQDVIIKKSRQENAVRELKEKYGMNASQIHKKLQESTDKTFHMSINTVRKIFKSL